MAASKVATSVLVVPLVAPGAAESLSQVRIVDQLASPRQPSYVWLDACAKGAASEPARMRAGKTRRLVCLGFMIFGGKKLDFWGPEYPTST